MIQKEFIPYEEALALEELGFYENTFAYYTIADKILINGYSLSANGFELKAPTFPQAFRWFRENHGLYHFEDHRCNSKTDMSSITYWMGIKKLKLAPFGSEVLVGIIELGCYNTYEEVELACLRKLIEIAKTK